MDSQNLTRTECIGLECLIGNPEIYIEGPGISKRVCRMFRKADMRVTERAVSIEIPLPVDNRTIW